MAGLCSGRLDGGYSGTGVSGSVVGFRVELGNAFILGPMMQSYYEDPQAQIIVGDVRHVLRQMPSESIHCVITSPPYWGLRDYGYDGQIGLEGTLEEYLESIVGVFRPVVQSD